MRRLRLATTGDDFATTSPIYVSLKDHEGFHNRMCNMVIPPSARPPSPSPASMDVSMARTAEATRPNRGVSVAIAQVPRSGHRLLPGPATRSNRGISVATKLFSGLLTIWIVATVHIWLSGLMLSTEWERSIDVIIDSAVLNLSCGLASVHVSGTRLLWAAMQGLRRWQVCGQRLAARIVVTMHIWPLAVMARTEWERSLDVSIDDAVLYVSCGLARLCLKIMWLLWEATRRRRRQVLWRFMPSLAYKISAGPWNLICAIRQLHGVSAARCLRRVLQLRPRSCRRTSLGVTASLCASATPMMLMGAPLLCIVGMSFKGLHTLHYRCFPRSSQVPLEQETSDSGSPRCGHPPVWTHSMVRRAQRLLEHHETRKRVQKRSRQKEARWRRLPLRILGCKAMRSMAGTCGATGNVASRGVRMLAALSVAVSGCAIVMAVVLCEWCLGVAWRSFQGRATYCVRFHGVANRHVVGRTLVRLLFFYCWWEGSTVSFGALLLMMCNSHCSHAGRCLTFTGLVALLACREARLGSPGLGAALTVCFPIFGNAPEMSKGGRLIEDAPMADAATPGLEPSWGSDVECDAPPTRDAGVSSMTAVESSAAASPAPDRSSGHLRRPPASKGCKGPRRLDRICVSACCSASKASTNSETGSMHADVTAGPMRTSPRGMPGGSAPPQTPEQVRLGAGGCEEKITSDSEDGTPDSASDEKGGMDASSTSDSGYCSMPNTSRKPPQKCQEPHSDDRSQTQENDAASCRDETCSITHEAAREQVPQGGDGCCVDSSSEDDRGVETSLLTEARASEHGTRRAVDGRRLPEQSWQVLGKGRCPRARGAQKHGRSIGNNSGQEGRGSKRHRRHTGIPQDASPGAQVAGLRGAALDGVSDLGSEADGENRQRTTHALARVRELSPSAVPDARRTWERFVVEVAARVRPNPTLPAVFDNDDGALHDVRHGAVHLPAKHCCFQRCEWQGDGEEDLRAHLVAMHMVEGGEMHSGDSYFPKAANRTEVAATIAHAAVAHVCRQGAPLACESIDRRALDNFHNCLGDDNITSLVCFTCACVFPHVAKRKKNQIKWVRPLKAVGAEPATFLNMDMTQARMNFGFHKYIERYGKLQDGPDLTTAPYREEFTEWKVSVPTPAEISKCFAVRKTGCAKSVTSLRIACATIAGYRYVGTAQPRCKKVTPKCRRRL